MSDSHAQPRLWRAIVDILQHPGLLLALWVGVSIVAAPVVGWLVSSLASPVQKAKLAREEPSSKSPAVTGVPATSTHLQ
jgi:hypothetical protein